MNKAREKTPALCAICSREFFPWRRKRAGPPTCSIKCARTLTGRAQRGKRPEKALAGLARRTQDEAEIVGRRFGATLTPREMAIFRHGINVGYDRG